MTDVWPESNPNPIYPLVVDPVFSTNVVDLGVGNEQRRSNWLFPKYDVTVHYHALSAAHAQVLWSFYMDQRGAYRPFYIYDLALLHNTTFAHIGLYCGLADGILQTFDLPGRSTSSQVIYLDGIVETAATPVVGGGDGGSDRVTFTSAPDEGMVVSADFTGYLRMRVRFAEDHLPREIFMRQLYTYGAIRLKGLGIR